MAICFVLAVAGIVVAVIGYDTPRAADCVDPPCSGRDALIIYGTVGRSSSGP
jgi:hypothetical protein